MAGEEIATVTDRLLVHADYLGRQGRNALAEELREAVDRARRLDLLNDFTKLILSEAAELTLPERCELTVSSGSDVVFARADGHWIGLRRTASPRGSYESWRGSLFRARRPFGSLRDAVLFFANLPSPAQDPDPD